MAMYQVLQDYHGRYREDAITLTEGQVVELPEETGEWVNRDRPGTLGPVDAAQPARKAVKGRTRQVTQADNREVQGDGVE